MKKAFTLLFICTFLFIFYNYFPFSGAEKVNSIKETGISLNQKIPKENLPKDLKVVCIGDSLTQGVGDSTGRGGYLPYLEEMLEKEKSINKAEFYNFGVRGLKTPQLLEKLETYKVKEAIKEADIVVITIGGNDVMNVVRKNFSNLRLQDFEGEKKLYEKRLNKTIEKVKTLNPDSTVLLLGLYNPFFKWFSDIKEMNRIISDWNNTSKSILSKYKKAYFVEVEDIFMESRENLLYKDYFHPNDKGYKLIAERMFETLKSQGLDKLTGERVTARKEENQVR
ncbi:SGNH/GDSL hydrolase family protein [Bacillus methanolicus]|uniref:GDSL-like lipase/acylhydrolase n=1 Tax=Bacillus methanolicus (strain MGA3 / ATCC 53907) TaxID=796606 RepID=I3E9L8_BACMM|nr:SGNH/GDSL hydrolase family protein [Bacillus methanolicus]AIE60437.1 GDSL-like lipase/acylhydrolase [Bacillus methanolicus MGA3]EIJ83189.1 GDSL-like lipase/acylhydrolase [Bacillus methanolicus MGA3]